MIPFLVQTLKSRWFAVAVHAGLSFRLFLAAATFGGKAPALRDSVPLSTPALSHVPVSKLEHPFAQGIWPRVLPDTNRTSLFFTKHFIPPTVPTPPPPTTRKIEITYLGFYQTEGSARQVTVKLANDYVVQPIGAHITTNWFAGPATIQSLTLTNLAGQTNLLPLNVKQEIEVPIP